MCQVTAKKEGRAAVKKTNHFKSYFDQIRVYPLLTIEEEKKLAERIQQGEKDAIQKLVEANLRLVVKIARSYRSSGIAFLDLIQEGNVGLIYAAERFDPKKGVRFSTYGSWWIRQCLLRFLANKQRIIRLPYRKEEILWKVQKSYHELLQRLNRMPSAAEIAKEIGVPENDVSMILFATSSILSLENTDPESTGVLEYHEDYTYNPERTLLKEDSKLMTMKILNSLKEREKKILMYRYQFTGSGRQTLKKISSKLGISPETVRQIELKAMEKIRGHPEIKNYFN